MELSHFVGDTKPSHFFGDFFFSGDTKPSHSVGLSDFATICNRPPACGARVWWARVVRPPARVWWARVGGGGGVWWWWWKSPEKKGKSGAQRPPRADNTDIRATPSPPKSAQCKQQRKEK